MSEEKILEELREAVFNSDSEATKRVAEKLVQAGIDPLKGVDAISDAARVMGEKYSRMEIFLPELVLVGEALKAGLDVLFAKIPHDMNKGKGLIIIGTVEGDIHELGKSIVAAMLRAEGFDVRDIGKDVPCTKFVEEAEKSKADIIAASALMTTTMYVQKDLIDYITALGLRAKFKIMVGGGVVTAEFADKINADGFGADAAEAAKVAKRLVSKD
ncbi:MAG: cobalamin-dependent protein [Candidatus Bathyarchaeia archaeon]